jgi:hypothetical protein
MRNGGVIPVPSALAIAQLTGDPGFYLYYLDSSHKELTDTYHSTIEQAKEQASFEFGVEESDWRPTSCLRGAPGSWNGVPSPSGA